MKRSLHVMIDRRIADDLANLAGMSDVTKSSIVEAALCQYLADRIYPATTNGQVDLNGWLYRHGRLDEADRKAAGSGV